jgi:hypothetical protein
MLLVGFNIFMGCPACLAFDLQWAPSSRKIDVSSLASQHVIKPGKLWFSIGLLVDWQSPVDASVRTKLINFFFIE